MASAQLSLVLRHIRKLAAGGSLCHATDQELLHRFVTRHEEAAFELLVERHGPAVLALCRRMLRHEQDAEDVFQATFLALARRAAAIRKPDALSCWLYGVASRLTLKVRASTAKRRTSEYVSTVRDSGDPLAELTGRELCAVLDEELSRLPARYQEPLVLCYLEGKTRDEAARQLGWSLSTLKRRLQHGREILRDRVTRRGLGLSAALTATVLRAQVTAAVPAALAVSTVKAALLFAAHGPAASAGASANAGALAEGVLKAMFLGKLKIATVLMLAASVATASVGLAVRGALADKQRAANPNSPEPAPAGANRAKPETKEQVRTDLYSDPLPPGAVARLGTVRWRHDAGIYEMSFSPDERIIAACSSRIVLWDVATGRELRHLPVTPTGRFGEGLHFSPDGKTLTVAEERNISFWNLANGVRLRSLSMPQPRIGPLVSCFSSDGKVLALAGEGDRAHLIDVASGSLLHEVGGHRAAIYSVAFSPDSTILALGTLKPSVQLWNINSGTLIRGIDHHKDKFVHAVAFSPDGKVVASGSQDTIILSDVASGKELYRLEAKMRDVIRLAFTADGRTLISGSDDAKVRFWDVKERRVLSTYGCSYGMLRSLAVTRDGRTLALGTDSCSALQWWNVATGKPLFTEFEGHDTSINCVAFTPNGKALLSASDKQQLLWWDLNTCKPKQAWKESACSLSLTPDRKKLAFVPLAFWPTLEKVVQVKDLGTGKNDLKLQVPDTDYVWRASFAGEGKVIVSIDSNRSQGNGGKGTGRLIVWEASTGRQLQSIKLPNVIPTALAVTSDARRAFVGGNSGEMHYCNLEAGTQTPLLCGHKQEVTDIASSPDGWLVVSGCLDRGVHLWETLTGKEVLALQGHRHAVAAVAFSPCGRLVATAGGALRCPYPVEDSPKIRIWDVMTGRQVAEFQGHDSNVTSLAFSPEGAALACGLSNSTAIVWEMPMELQRTKLSPQSFAPQDLTRFWEDLASSDAAQARQAIWSLTACPHQALRLIQARLKPASPLDTKQIQRWISDLNSNQFATREKAAQELEGLGELAEQPLKNALENRPAPEMQRRIERLLEKTHAPVMSPELIRFVRSVEVLERIGTAEAQDALKGLTRGDPQSRMTQQAKASLEHLAKRTSPSH